MALDFPASPIDGQAYGSYIYNATVGAWQSKEDPATVAVTSPIAPASANNGDIWYNTNTGVSYIYYNDGTSAQWVEVVSSAVPALNTKADLAGATFTGNVTAPRIISNIATGTAPLGVTSTTVVSNLNADLLDGNHASSFAQLSGATFTGNIGAPQLISNATTGQAPMQINSTNIVLNLNADLLDGQHGSYYAPLNNPTFTGTISAPLIVNSAFDFVLGNGDQVTRGDSGSSRALVKIPGSKLYMNYSGDFTGGTVIDSKASISGILSTPSQPAFYSAGSGTFVLSGVQQDYLLPFTTVDLNRGNCFNSSNYRFTAPVAGVYYFWMQACTTDATSTGPEIYIIKNGSAYNNVAISYNSAYYNTFGAGYVINLNANDYVQMAVRNNNGTTFTIERGRSRFAGYLMG